MWKHLEDLYAFIQTFSAFQSPPQPFFTSSFNSNTFWRLPVALHWSRCSTSVTFSVNHCYGFTNLHFNYYFNSCFFSQLREMPWRQGLWWTAVCLPGPGIRLDTWWELSKWLWTERLWYTFHEREWDLSTTHLHHVCVYVYKLFMYKYLCIINILLNFNFICLNCLSYYEVSIKKASPVWCLWNKERECLSNLLLGQEEVREMPSKKLLGPLLLLGNWNLLGLFMKNFYQLGNYPIPCLDFRSVFISRKVPTVKELEKLSSQRFCGLPWTKVWQGQLTRQQCST